MERSFHSFVMVNWLSGIVVAGSGLFLIGLAAVIATRPALAQRFLTSFASSARAHYTEQGVRLVAGAAMVNFAPLMWFSNLFWVFGWILVITTVGLLLIPWRWHNRFGTWAIPLAIRHLKFVAAGASALGGLIILGVVGALISTL